MGASARLSSERLKISDQDWSRILIILLRSWQRIEKIELVSFVEFYRKQERKKKAHEKPTYNNNNKIMFKFSPQFPDLDSLFFQNQTDHLLVEELAFEHDWDSFL